MNRSRSANGALLIYHHPLISSAPTIMEHVNAFKEHSRFNIWTVNTETGFPKGLEELTFKVLILHYSLFGPYYYLNDRFLNYLGRSRESYKIAFFQDEHRFCQRRFSFVNRYNIDCIYTLLDPLYFMDVYQKYTSVRTIIHCLTGYVSDDLINAAKKINKSPGNRQVDIGYRGRNLAFYMGKGAQEKNQIGMLFKEHAAGLHLRLDIETEEPKRIYSKDWYKFLANCKGVLGVEAGVSIFDIEDKVREECDQLISKNPAISFEKISEKVLNKWEGNIPYRTISPRHFEAAALRVCQILFEGNYSGIMTPMVHYIPLKKDFSNFDDVIRMFRDETLRLELTENAYQDLIESGRYSYRRFVQDVFDKSLSDSGLKSSMRNEEALDVTAFLKKDEGRRHFYAAWRSLRYRPFPGRQHIIPPARRVFRAFRKLSRSGSSDMNLRNA